MTTLLRSRVAPLVAGVLIAGTFGAAGVLAVVPSGHITYSGGALVATKVATDEDGWASSAIDTWQTVTGSSLSVTVPSGTTRLVTGHFIAESYCTGDAAWCSVRIVARKQGGTTIYEFRPRVGNDFAFDEPSDEDYEGNSVSRTFGLPNGTWNVWVQAMVVGGTSGTAMYLDDWHFEVDVFKP